MKNAAFTLVMLPPHDEIRRGWAKAVAGLDIGVNVLQPETTEEAIRDIADAEAAFGTIQPEVLAAARRLRWLQAPNAAPPAGFYYPELVAHPVVVTNFREIFNDHIGAHIMAFVLAFARDLHTYLPQQMAREYLPRPLDTGVVHLPESTALILGVGGIGSEAARLCAAFGMRVIGVDARRTDRPEGVAELHGADKLDALLPRADFVIMTIPHTPATVGLMDRARLRLHEAQRVPDQHRPRHDRAPRRPRRRAACRRDRRRRPRRVRDRAAAARRIRCGRRPTCSSRRTPPATAPTSTTAAATSSSTTAAASPPAKPLRNVVDKAAWF